MKRRPLFLSTVVLASLAIAGVAEAEGGGRARTVTQRPANTALTVQEGRGNAAGILQTGAGNTAGLLQFGRNNTGTILQAGSNNNACLIQTGRNLDGAIVQVGDNLTTGTLQNRWGTTEIPVEVCSTATTRRDLAAYAPQRAESDFRIRTRRRGRGEP